MHCIIFPLPYGGLYFVHGHHVGALLALALLGLGEEGGEALGHAGDGDHVAVGDHGVEAGAARLGGVPGQILGISAEIKVAISGGNILIKYKIE